MNVNLFKFSNLCGSVYTNGNVVFTPDGNSIFSPVGNRVTCFDLVNHNSLTFSFENRKNISRLAISPSGHVLVTIDEDGHALVTNAVRGLVVHEFHFKEHVRDAKFSPDGRYLAITHGRRVQVWNAPGTRREFSPFVLHCEFLGHYDDVMCLDWSPDSQFVVSGSRDHTARVYSISTIAGFEPRILSGHRDCIISCFFSANGSQIYTIAKDSAVYVWQRQSSISKGDSNADDVAVSAPYFKFLTKHLFTQEHSRVNSAAFHAAAKLLVVGFYSGLFGVYEIGDALSQSLAGDDATAESSPVWRAVHTLSISSRKITSSCINSTGQWLAFGCAGLGQLLVWEWQSETYVLKQQGHAHDLNAVAFSPDGQVIASGGEDGKIKIWNHSSGFCFATLSWHTGPITALQFVPNGSALLSSSLDGSVRATDLIRYRNFRTMVAPKAVQFSCMAVDGSGEIVAAGAVDTFDIYVWSLQNGRLLDVLSAHTAPLSTLAFNPTSGTMASGSWDGSVMLWDVYGGKAVGEKLQHSKEVLAVTFRPDGRELCAATLDGTITFWDPFDVISKGSIEGRRDVAGGRKAMDRMTAKNSASNKHFNSLCYSADGQAVLAGGNSKHVCVYDAVEKVMLRRFVITKNRSVDGVVDFLNSRNMTAAGPRDLIDDPDDEDDEARFRDGLALPGVRSGNMSSRRVRPAVHTKCVRFSPTGRAWAAASTEGVLIYSMDEQFIFDPADLDQDLTPDSVLHALSDKDYSRALVMSLRLNEQDIMQCVLESIPSSEVHLSAASVPPAFLPRLLSFLGLYMESSRRVELCVRWSVELLTRHGRYIQEHVSSCLPPLRQLHKSIEYQRSALSKMCDENTYTLAYMASVADISGSPVII
mmetsp:Transcript_31292/g.50530  ORF Transcript_31292/g.50530 Transcript_31292/m.50530 type:complete len:872 (+) Transcript_31292:144-2759(+)|eukprot:CAMPEP_0184653822 /NCGR_PEP_ID=MMETSP0308-20130426/11531_1 /TAXON_ID=38269 /ORGANISM="Gloeochaete witrockiana, Strain SAG 46.84" /LENGTH=871 /DNA_ID=CAMNT_0027089475 /DNA_START=95 /DNA_END=2710 /DNA_ORIENTATION=+